MFLNKPPLVLVAKLAPPIGCLAWSKCHKAVAQMAHSREETLLLIHSPSLCPFAFPHAHPARVVEEGCSVIFDGVELAVHEKARVVLGRLVSGRCEESDADGVSLH